MSRRESYLMFGAVRMKRNRLSPSSGRKSNPENKNFRRYTRFADFYWVRLRFVFVCKLYNPKVEDSDSRFTSSLVWAPSEFSLYPLTCLHLTSSPLKPSPLRPSPLLPSLQLTMTILSKEFLDEGVNINFVNTNSEKLSNKPSKNFPLTHYNIFPRKQLYCHFELKPALIVFCLVCNKPKMFPLWKKLFIRRLLESN